MKKVKEKKYVALILLVVLIIGIILINKVGNIDIYKGLINIKEAYINNIDKLQANAEAIKGYDEIEIEVAYTLEESNITNKDIEIHAQITEEENKYAYFEEIKKENITTELNDNKSKIKIKIKGAKTGVENKIKLKMTVQGAPDGFKVTPKITIVESEENKKDVNTKSLQVETNSVIGIVKDEKNMPVSNIELKITKDNKEIKRTSTDSEGKYVFTDLEKGNYKIEIVEEKYQQTNIEEIQIEKGTTYNISIKKQEGYNIKVQKRIRKVTLNVNGKETEYSYQDLEKVVETVRNAKEISGTITYNITVKNTGKKAGVVGAIKDTIPEGLKFDEKKNPNWELRNKSLYSVALEGITLEKGEEKTSTLILDIEKTNEAKTYLNEITGIGEEYEKVVYILNGEKYC